jgi:hypothetical protein
MRMEPHFDKANEIYFRLGIIYKQQQKYQQSLEVCYTSQLHRARLTKQCFQYIVGNPPQPLTQEDIWFQIGHVYEQQKDVSRSNLHQPFSKLASLNLPKAHTDESLTVIRTMPKSSSS